MSLLFLSLGEIFGLGLLLFSLFLSHLTFRGFRLSLGDLLLRQPYWLLNSAWYESQKQFMCAHKNTIHTKHEWERISRKFPSIAVTHWRRNKQEYKVQRRIKINNDGTASDEIHDPFHDYDDDKWRLVSLMSNVHGAEQDLMEFLVTANDFAGWLMKEKNLPYSPDSDLWKI